MKTTFGATRPRCAKQLVSLLVEKRPASLQALRTATVPATVSVVIC